MMKQKIALLLSAILLFSVSCGKESSSHSEIQTAFRFEECGLAYKIPDAWVETKDSTLIPSPLLNPNGEIYTQICYHYVPNENLEALNDMDSDISVDDLMIPLVEILVVKEANLESEAVKAELALYHTVEELPAQEEFRFFFLTDYIGNTEHFSKKAQKTFETLKKHLPQFKESIETFLPDETAIQQPTEEDGKYLTFLSNTLQGDSVSTAIFYDYDLTVVNFWASYCEEDGINELDELQTFYKKLLRKHPNVNFVQVVIDTPSEQAEEIALTAYENASVTFTGIMPDQHLARWIMENLNGLPTTIFVDNKGMPRSLKIEGMQNANYYMEVTESILQTIAE